MKLAVRVAIYIALLIIAMVALGQFRKAYQSGPSREFEAPEVEKPAVAAPAASTDTNAVAAAASTDAASTNAPAATAENAGTNTVADASSTNAPAAAPTPVTAATTPASPSAKAGRNGGSVIYLGIFILSFLGLGALAAWDVSQYLGGRAGRSVMAEDYIDRKDPDYEKAEEEWAKGNHLDAIQLMRDYLNRNPQEQHAAIRIAEIYEKDLGNYLAAALELEEVLTKKLPREKWGWTAVRLSNIYSGRLNQPDKALAVLNRIVNHYPDTAAAKKARQRLGIPEPTPEAVEEAAESVAEESAEPEPTAEAPSEPAPESPNPDHLPKGFRKKK